MLLAAEHGLVCYCAREPSCSVYRSLCSGLQSSCHTSAACQSPPAGQILAIGAQALQLPNDSCRAQVQRHPAQSR